MKQIRLLIFLLFASFLAEAQVTGLKNVPGDYATLELAIADLNTVGVGAGGATINILGGNPQTAPSNGYQLGSAVLNPTLTAANPLVINGNNNTATANTGVGLYDAIFTLNGADYVNINGLNLAESVSNTDNTMRMEWGYALLKRQNVAPYDGCQFNTIQNCTITLNKLNTNTNSYGIYGNNHIALNNLQLSVSAVGDANSNNTIKANTIQNVNSGILLQGSSNVLYYDLNNTVGGVSAADGNILQNFGSTVTTYGIYTFYQDMLVIRNNNLNNMNGGGSAASTTQYGIYTSTATNANVTIRQNNVNLTQGSLGILYCIWNSSGGTNQLNTINIDSNTVTYNHLSSGSTTYGIYNSGAAANINFNANKVENVTTSGTGTHYLLYPAGTCYTAYNINDNKITNINRTAASGGTYGIYTTGGVGSSAVIHSHQRNKVDRVFYSGVSNSGLLYAIYDFSGTCVKTYKNDTVINCNIKTGTNYLLYTYNYGPGGEISSNYIANDTSGGTMGGIFIGSTTFNNNDIKDNIITGLYNIGASSTVYGFYLAGATVSVNLLRNNIYNIQSQITTSGALYGMYISAGTLVNIYNNFISDLRTPVGNSTSPVYGMFFNGGTDMKVYHNTINLNPVSAGPTFGATGIYYTPTPTMDLRNNIIRVNATPMGSGFVAALRRSTGTAGTAPANLASTSNSNIYFAPNVANSYWYGEGTVNPLINAYNLTNDPNMNTSCANYKTFMSPRESSSFTENNLVAVAVNPPTFAPSGSSYGQNNAQPTAAPAVTNDYALVVRGNPADVGALEFASAILDATAPTITYTPISNVSNCGGLPILTATITDVSGVNATAGTKPRVYYKKSTENNALVGNTNLDNGWKYVEASNAASPFTFQLNPALLTLPPVLGDVIQYFVVAQDNVVSPNPNVGKNQVAFAPGYCPVSVNLLPGGFPTQANPPVNSFTVTAATPIVLGPTASPSAVCNPGTTTLTTTDTTSAPGTFPTGYLTSSASSTADDELFRFQIVGTALNNVSNCATTGGGAANGLPASIVARYANYTATIPPITLTNGTLYNGSVDLSNCNGFGYSMGLAVFIDYNRNGVIDPVAERAYGSPGTLAGGVSPAFNTYTFSFTVPANAGSGPTLMRVIVVESQAGTGISPTGTYSWGETEDYQIYLNNPNVITANALPNGAFVWTPAANIATNPNRTVTASNIVANTIYTVTATDGGGCTATSTVAVNLALPMAITGVTGTTAYCDDVPSTSLTILTTGGSSPINTIWTGGPVVTVPTVPVCLGQQAGFAGPNVPANWTTVQVAGGNGSVNAAGAPANVVLTGPNGTGGNAYTRYERLFNCAGTVSFNWNVVHADPGYDGFGYYKNGTYTQLTAVSASGSTSVPIAAGDIFAFYGHTFDGCCGTFNATISNLLAPSSQMAIAGTTAVVNPPAGTTVYTVTAVDPCGTTATTTVSVTVTVPPVPTAVTATPATICPGETANLNATSAGNTINWFTVPTGGVAIGSSASGANFPVTPVVTTTYYASQAQGPNGSQVFNYTGSIVNWTVPALVTSVTITAKGAQGGAGGSPLGVGGLGASMTGTFAVTPGQVLKVLVGQVGGGISGSAGAGGGGGSFVTDSANNAPWIIAGGGGGRHGNAAVVGIDAVTTTSGLNGNSVPAGYPTYYGVGGVNGNGATNGPNSPHAGNGGGLLTNGLAGACGGPGFAFVNGGAGGTACVAPAVGGFGGAGGGGNWGAGGGGGYSGGGGSYHGPSNGGGGGSFNNGTNQTNLVNNTGDGQVTILWSAPCASARVPVTVNVNVAPTVTASANPNPACSGAPTVLTGGGAVSYLWNPGALVGNPTVTPLVATTYTVTGTDGQGCTASSTVAVAVNPTPSSTITQSPANPLACGVIPTLTAPLGQVVPANGARYYIRDAEPWGSPSYVTGLNAVFGAGNYTSVTYGAANPATIFVPGTQFVYMEGSSGTEAGQTAYLAANLPAIEAWVNNGGRLLINRAPNSGAATTNFGFGGVTNNYNNAQGTVNVVAGDAIGAGPFLPSGYGPYTGSSYSHAHITGGGTTPMITGGGFNVLTKKSWGSGLVLFGGYTAPSFHGPAPNAQNLFQNWVSYCATSAQGAPLSYLWAPGGATTQSISAPTTGVYTVTVTQGSCSSTGTISVTVNPNPVVTANPATSTVCAGASVTLAGGGDPGVTYVWSGGISDNTPFTPVATTTYTVTGTGANGCTATATALVTVNPVLTGTGSATPNPICLGASTTITASATTLCAGNVSDFAGIYAPANWTFSVTNSNGTVNTGGAPANIVISSGNNLSGNPGSTNYTNTMSCSGNVTFNWSYTNADAFGSIYDYPRYTINGGAPVTFPGFVVGGSNSQTGTGSIPVASGDVFQFQMYTIDNDPTQGFVTISNFTAPASAVTGTVSIWDSPSGGNNLGASPQTVTPAAAGTVNYYVEITSNGPGSCVNPTRVAVPVTVNSFTNLTASASPAAICLGGSSVLTGSNGASYVWNPGGLTGSPTVSPIATTIYTVEGTDANGCTATSTVEVVVNGNPVVTASASPATICLGGSSTLTGGGASTYGWDPGALVGSPTVSPIATTNYTVTGTDANGCTATSTVDVVVNGLPVVTANPATQTVCEMGMATVSGGGAATYAWTGGISDATPFMVMAPAVYTVTGTDANGCTNTATAEVLMNTLPVITAGATPATTCDMTTVTPSASGAITIGWSGGLTNNVPFVATATTTYTVTGTDGNGCTNSTTVLVTVTPMSGILAPATSNQSQDHGDDFDINYYAANCDLIATVDDGAGGNVLGMTTSTVNVDATAGMHNGQPFVRRWYQITPTTNGAADVVLYINQSDFDDYNAAVLLPYLPLPILGNNADPNIANIRITKNADAGLGNSPVVITPTVNWNGTYWELSFSTPNFSQFRVHSVNPGNVPLPVTITHFSGLKLETSDQLSWTTSSEQNNAYFNLQHSTDGINFTTLAKVNSKAANGNSATPLNYSAINSKPVLGHNYYRLQQTDLDNKLSVHAQIVDLIWGANGSTVSIYPNPTTDILNIDLYAATAQNTTVKLLDMSGRVIKQIQAKSAVGMNNIKLSMGEIASGVYTIQVYENNTLSHTSKVKKND